MSFTCPYCKHHSTITDPDRFKSWHYINMQKTKHGQIGFSINAVRCPNKDCNELILKGTLTAAEGGWKELWVIKKWNLLPESIASILPGYVSEAIKEDYYEACVIKDLSPKASATLARRCLQGMIRDFWGISKSRLQDEIEAIKDKVDPETWSAIDAVRSIGNIGAHMEKDVNVIIDIEPDEASLLIGLIENLIEDWYVTRYNRRQRNQAVVQLANEKSLQKQANLAAETQI